jgi:glycosyltransferase involved in cell wall biosynthesis
MVGMDDVRGRHGAREPDGHRVGRVAEVRDRPQRPDDEPAGLAHDRRPGAERHDLAVDMTGERPPQLDRVALSAAEDAAGAEGGRSDVDDTHLVLPLLTVGDPQRLTGGYLYHLRMAAAAPRHDAQIVFASFPERPFGTGALDGPRLLRVLRALRPDAILLDSIAAAHAAPWLALRAPPVPVIGTLHQPPGGIDHGSLRTRAQAPLDRLAYRGARLLLVASEHLADQLAAQGVARERLCVVPPGRDVALPPDGAGPDLRDGRGAAFLCVGNWVARKGILELLEAFAALPSAAATLHLAGDEDAQPGYAHRVRRRLQGRDLAGRVVRHGALPRESVAALYAAADAFVLPAFREPYGTVWGEAMAFGLPVAGWRAGNLPYLADDGREGLLVAPGDVAALTRALAALAGDEALRRRLGEAGRRRALRRPTWDQSAEAFFGAIRGAIGAGGAGRGQRRRPGVQT